MSPKSRFVVDTNTLVSSILISNSISDKAVKRIRQSGIILSSVETLEELRVVLSRSKFDKYVDSATRSEFVAQFVQQSELVTIEETVTVCRDPKDDKFLELAVNGKADYLITGDKDLLVLHPFRDIEIINPSDFFNISS
ncbi:putative toxin-antitoxin system toxin component, PIN family [Pseudanabaena sp. FACHB-1998]|uniref:putative toxin-antitoxin system toxin component, PIN family n=1 Tax=Pseudanabaena sp. FACHB-1998 TaxID=2692858 RepID=UPI001680380B|nr:putative toxin-antitoxin system toxin component, PIN family [Pseudanabaena sp. FACHB-1998]MBD2176679.1 putative toxin-antitoxin system toxin component, PIN family [Pseudanabaena sp. FACHB-1998]